MVAATLKTLDDWYNEAEAQTNDRPMLLSKLALLELCGWIEGEFDQLVINAEAARVSKVNWLNDEVIEKTYGFHYQKHLRVMLTKVFGEILVGKIELEMEVQFPGQLDRFKSILGSLWDKRCSFAHADYLANVAAQKRFDAPSWSRAQHSTVSQLIGNFNLALTAVVRNI